ncbi:Oligoribonuclease NrnB [compost metagenome]
MRKVKLFTHTDLDGVGCAIVAFRVFGRENVDVEYCENTEIHDAVRRFLYREEYELYDQIFITDMSVSPELAEMIDKLHRFDKITIYLFDHHSTALWLDEYSWATVTTHLEDCKTSGTELLYDHFESLLEYSGLWSFVELVRSYDTWDWYAEDDMDAKRLNDLYYLIGRNRFVDRFTENSDALNLSESENMLLDIESERIHRYIGSKVRDCQYIHIDNYFVVVVFADQYLSELGNELTKLNPDCHFVAMITGKNISYRTNRDDVHVGEFAQLHNGGGHAKAAGSPLTKQIQKKLVSIPFKPVWWKALWNLCKRVGS